jgi:hypothetical protein
VFLFQATVAGFAEIYPLLDFDVAVGAVTVFPMSVFVLLGADRLGSFFPGFAVFIVLDGQV